MCCPFEVELVRFECLLSPKHGNSEAWTTLGSRAEISEVFRIFRTLSNIQGQRQSK